MKTNTYILVVMGVSGCGKSTIGELLANELTIPFFDGDDYHPKENIDKMSSGQSLNDNDRHGWLVTLNKLAHANSTQGAVIACSALKQSYRNILKHDFNTNFKFVYLDGSFDEIQERLNNRKGHFMPAHLLKSQFSTLEKPTNAIAVSITLQPEEIVKQVLKKLH